MSPLRRVDAPGTTSKKPLRFGNVYRTGPVAMELFEEDAPASETAAMTNVPSTDSKTAVTTGPSEDEVKRLVAEAVATATEAATKQAAAAAALERRALEKNLEKQFKGKLQKMQIMLKQINKEKEGTSAVNEELIRQLGQQEGLLEDAHTQHAQEVDELHEQMLELKRTTSRCQYENTKFKEFFLHLRANNGQFPGSTVTEQLGGVTGANEGVGA